MQREKKGNFELLRLQNKINHDLVFSQRMRTWIVHRLEIMKENFIYIWYIISNCICMLLLLKIDILYDVCYLGVRLIMIVGEKFVENCR